MSHTSESEDSQHDRCQSMTSLIQINRILSLHGFRMVHWYLFFFFQSYYWQTKACYLQCEFYLSALFSFTLSLWSDFSNSTCLTPSAKFILSFFLFLRRNTICIFLRPLFFFSRCGWTFQRFIPSFLSWFKKISFHPKRGNKATKTQDVVQSERNRQPYWEETGIK